MDTYTPLRLRTQPVVPADRFAAAELIRSASGIRYPTHFAMPPDREEKMTDEEKINAAAAYASQQKSIELLFDYTKFHIGLYLTITAAYVTVATAKINEKLIFDFRQGYIVPAIIAFVIAGTAGGVIASSLTQTTARSTIEFLDSRIGPWELKEFHFRARVWTWIEHTSFWIGLLFALFSFLRPASPPLN